MSAAPALEAVALRKAFAGRAVVDGVDLRVETGSVLGLLGPNGAGKTTTLRMLYGFLEPDSGVIRYGGVDFAQQRDALKRWIGVCTQDDTLDNEFDVRANLLRFTGYFRPAVPDRAARVDALLARFGLLPFAGQRPETLSGGFRRRLMIARAVVHAPRVLFLDEPTTGLDPLARVEVWDLIAGLRRDGLAIVLTTHYMEEAERLSDRLVVLASGRTVAAGAPREVIGELLGEHVVVLPAGASEHTAVAAWACAQGVRVASVLGEVRLPLHAAQLAAFAVAFPQARYEVRAPTLDDLFLRLAVAA